ncbi:hypothetical protein FSP39_024566 [Pinctada imbricata]|uniref:Uncharacterized protein n=1 Tax=Pinctada imbricata TaxID=66713 RepID=A0AA88Y6D7_PINIB|nr:hypothetical protein FSP39_024566 [Pinctada imbricata]
MVVPGMQDYSPSMDRDFGSIVNKQVNSDILRQSASTCLDVGITSLEIHRNRVAKRVKTLDVKLSFSYQDNYQTETDRLEKTLIRHGKKWTWPVEHGKKCLLNFPYCPGDRVNLNVGLIVHETKTQGIFNREKNTEPVGNAAECIVLSRNNGVGIGLPLNTVINQHIRLNFDLDGYGHHMSIKLKLEVLGESKANPSLWLRPSTWDKPFRTSLSIYDIITSGENFPPRQKAVDDNIKQRGFVCNCQKLVNYLRTTVLECWSFRSCNTDTDIPSAIQIRQANSNKPVACMVPVVQHKAHLGKQQFRLALLVLGSKGPYCLSAIRWRSADKFDFKIHYYEKDETWGQRVKWAARDFLDIDHIIMNSTGHQYYFKSERDNSLMDLCVGLGLKFLVRWSDETFPWKRDTAREISDEEFDSCNSKEAQLQANPTEIRYRLSSTSSLNTQVDNLPKFLESQSLALYCDIDNKLSGDICDLPPEPEVPRSRLQRRGSGSSYGESNLGSSSNHGSERYIKKEQKYKKKDLKKGAIDGRGTQSDGDDFTSGFVEDFTGYTSTGPASCPGSYVGIESLIE